MRKLISLVIITAMFFCIPVMAQAEYYLDFNLNGNNASGASISYAGGTSSLVGQGIGIDYVVVKDTDNEAYQGNKIYLNALLSFSTGANTAASSNAWTFDGGKDSSIKVILNQDLIIQGVNVLTKGTVLLEGWNVQGNVYSTIFTSAKGKKKIIGTELLGFQDTKNATLLTLLGMPQGSYEGYMNYAFTIGSVNDQTYSFSTSVLGSGDLENYHTTVPVPAAFWLLGSGLLGLVGVRRKR